jgi:TnpA family transposase
MRNQSTIQPTTIHSDIHGQNLPVFGLAHLLGVELMPRIRNWKDLRFYRPDKNTVQQEVLFVDKNIRPAVTDLWYRAWRTISARGLVARN